ncbi:hypothetical protein [Streptomyces sp. NPDC054783]
MFSPDQGGLAGCRRPRSADAVTAGLLGRPPRRRSRLPYRAFMLTQYATCLVQLTTELS